jgi:hypothetical protein
MADNFFALPGTAHRDNLAHQQMVSMVAIEKNITSLPQTPI